MEIPSATMNVEMTGGNDASAGATPRAATGPQRPVPSTSPDSTSNGMFPIGQNPGLDDM